MQKGELSAKIFTLQCLFVCWGLFVPQLEHVLSTIEGEPARLSSMFFFLYICSLHVGCYREGETAGPGSKSDGKHPKVTLSAGGSF